MATIYLSYLLSLIYFFVSICSVVSNVDNGALLVQGALSQCSALLVTLGGAVAEGTQQEGIELVQENLDQNI